LPIARVRIGAKDHRPIRAGKARRMGQTVSISRFVKNYVVTGNLRLRWSILCV
jgi:hypothetical protein